MNYLYKLLILSMLSLPLLQGCLRQEIRTLQVDVPGMKTAACAKHITDALNAVDGVLTASPDLDNFAIEIRYDSRKLAQKNVEFIITGAGFIANEFPANAAAQAALSEECR